jgi:carbamoyl-phosphate synthase small subunit
MDNQRQNKAILLFDDGTYYEGTAAGLVGTTTGEVCFNTSMTGYQEIFTDPSYFGQVLLTTNVHVGNYGIKNDDVESEKIQISGLICRNFTNEYSRPMADLDIQKYFEDNKVVCIHDVDTREIVRSIRDKGVMNCIISSEIFDLDELKSRLAAVPSMEGLELASQVSTSEIYHVGNIESPYRIGVMDFGTKRNILNSLAERGCYLTVFPAKTPASQVIAAGLDGFFLSNGPGDPASMDYAIATAQSLIDTGKPLFGICLGHQILALANGIDTYKMHHGHRGSNHPVINTLTGKCEITTQNHGFSVKEEDVISKASHIEITHKNLNDNTIEGIRMIDKPAFSVQFHPEANPGPHDSKYLFDQFVENIKQAKNN